MPRPRKIQKPEMAGHERVAAIARLLALGVVRLASREQVAKQRYRTGLNSPSKHSLEQLKKLKTKGK